MLDGFHQVRGGDKAFYFVFHFYSEPSCHFRTNDTGDTHVIHQGKGGQEGDAFIPMLWTFAQHGALFLQDFPVFARCRESDLQNICRRFLISMPAFKFTWVKTEVWNRDGIFPPACPQMQEAVARADGLPLAMVPSVFGHSKGGLAT